MGDVDTLERLGDRVAHGFDAATADFVETMLADLRAVADAAKGLRDLVAIR